jgi:hypothetical protein
MKLPLTALFALAFAASASATDYALRGHDAAGQAVSGWLSLTPARDQVHVDVRLGPARWTGTIDHADGRAEGGLVGSAGLSGAVLEVPDACIAFQATFDATTVRGTCGATTFTGHVSVTALERDALWDQVRARPYTTLPALGSRGVGEHLWDTLQALRKKVLERTFSTASDVRPERVKLFHPFGSVASVVYEARAGHPYTGLFASGGEGLARLSLATDDESYIPGIALKLFVAGAPSVNIHAIPSFEPQRGRDFFERAPSNVIPPPTDTAIRLFMKLAARVADPLRRPEDHVASPPWAPTARPSRSRSRRARSCSARRRSTSPPTPARTSARSWPRSRRARSSTRSSP